MTPETRKMKLFSLALLIGGLLGLVNVAVLVIGAGPSIDSAILFMIFGSCVVLAVTVVGQLILTPSVTLQFIELFALLAMASAVARGSHKVKKSLEAK